MPLVELRSPEQRGIQGRASCQRLFLSLAPAEEAAAGVSRRGEVEGGDLPAPLRKDARDAGQRRLVDDLDRESEIFSRTGKDLLPEAVDLLGREETGGVQACADGCGEVDRPTA